MSLTLALAAWMFRDPIQSWITQRAVLASDIPSLQAVEYLCEQAQDPDRIVQALWDTGKIHHRQLAIRQMQRYGAAIQPLPDPMERILLEGAMDADVMIRENALRHLRSRGHPALWPLAAAHLRDPDPALRLLGLHHLKFAPPETALPLVVSLLDDPDLRVVATSLRWMGNWTDRDYGVLISQSQPDYDPTSGRLGYSAGQRAQVGAAAAEARRWWRQHHGDPPPVFPEHPDPIPAPARLMAGDFTLPTLDGRPVRLSDLRGKTVLINFWASWCAPCLAEIPELTALHRRHASRLTILGVSLDQVPDMHGHVGGHDESAPPRTSGPDPKEMRRRLERVVREHDIPYTILLDRENRVGGRFNAGELPTTLILDAEGGIRRRLVGPRTLPEFEAMIAEVR